MQVEIIYRFGLLPEAIKNLFQLTELKLLAQKLGIKKIVSGAQGGRIEFNEKPNINPANIIQLIQNNPSKYQLNGATGLRFMGEQLSAKSRITTLQTLLNRFLK